MHRKEENPGDPSRKSFLFYTESGRVLTTGINRGLKRDVSSSCSGRTSIFPKEVFSAQPPLYHSETGNVESMKIVSTRSLVRVSVCVSVVSSRFHLIVALTHQSSISTHGKNNKLPVSKFQEGICSYTQVQRAQLERSINPEINSKENSCQNSHSGLFTLCFFLLY